MNQFVEIYFYTLPLALLFMPELFLLVIALIVLAIGSFTDFRSREVPDWLSYAGIVLGALIRIVWSITSSDYHPLLWGVLGFAIFWLVGAVMYYTGQWGGGDAKILMALGTIMGVQLSVPGVQFSWYSWYTILWSDFMISFLINSLLIGAVYGIVWLALLSIKKYAELNQSWITILARESSFHWASLSSFVICIALALFLPVGLQPVMLLLAVWCLLFFYLFVWLKSVEESCMKVQLPVSQVTEGDWIAEEVVVSGKRICGPHYEGITKKQLELLQKLSMQGKIKQVLVKQGIPFVPNFLIAFVVTMVAGNLVLFLP